MRVLTNINTYCTLRGRIKGAASATYICRLHGGTRNTARHVITVIAVAFLTQENKAGTRNQLKHGKGRAVRNNTRDVVSIDQYSTLLRLVLYCYPHTPCTIIACTALPSVL